MQSLIGTAGSLEKNETFHGQSDIQDKSLDNKDSALQNYKLGKVVNELKEEFLSIKTDVSQITNALRPLTGITGLALRTENDEYSGEFENNWSELPRLEPRKVLESLIQHIRNKDLTDRHLAQIAKGYCSRMDFIALKEHVMQDEERKQAHAELQKQLAMVLAKLQDQDGHNTSLDHNILLLKTHLESKVSIDKMKMMQEEMSLLASEA